MCGSKIEQKDRAERIQAETAETHVFGHGPYDHDYGSTIYIQLGTFNSEEEIQDHISTNVDTIRNGGGKIVQMIIRHKPIGFLRIISSGLLCHVIWQMFTDISDERSVSIFKVEI
jgi:hypothetical protein